MFWSKWKKYISKWKLFERSFKWAQSRFSSFFRLVTAIRWSWHGISNKPSIHTFSAFLILDPLALFLMLLPNELSKNNWIGLILKLFPRAFYTFSIFLVFTNAKVDIWHWKFLPLFFSSLLLVSELFHVLSAILFHWSQNTGFFQEFNSCATVGQTDRRTDRPSYRDARTHLKTDKKERERIAAMTSSRREKEKKEKEG